MNWSFRNYNSLFSEAALGQGAQALAASFFTWMLVKCIEPSLPNARVWDLAYVVVLLGVICFSIVPGELGAAKVPRVARATVRVLGRILLPFLCVASAVAPPAIWFALLAVQRIEGMSPSTAGPMPLFALEWFGAGCVLMVIAFGLRGGLLAITVNVASLVFAIASALAIHAIALHANVHADSRELVTESIDLAMNGAAQAALWPMAFVITGWALSTVVPAPEPRQVRPRKPVGEALLDAAFYLAAMYVHVWQHAADFSSRARRKEFWLFQLANILLASLLLAPGILVFRAVAENAFIMPQLYVVASLAPQIAVTVRRLHDTGKSAWCLLVLLIPVLGYLLFLTWLIQDSDPRTNAWGESIKAVRRAELAAQ